MAWLHQGTRKKQKHGAVLSDHVSASCFSCLQTVQLLGSASSAGEQMVLRWRSIPVLTAYGLFDSFQAVWCSVARSCTGKPLQAKGKSICVSVSCGYLCAVKQHGLLASLFLFSHSGVQAQPYMLCVLMAFQLWRHHTWIWLMHILNTAGKGVRNNQQTFFKNIFFFTLK